MKTNVLVMFLLLAAIGSLCCAYALSEFNAFAKTKQKMDEQGHVLVERWKEYYAARKADRPDDELSALETIIQQAEKSRLSWDFYDAWQKKEMTASARNWKTRAANIAARDAAYDAYNEPVINVVRGKLEFSGIASDNAFPDAAIIRKQLMSSQNRAFYREASVADHCTREALLAALENDYQFALWHFLDLARYYPVNGGASDSSGVKRFDAVLSEIVRQSDGKYPQNAIAEYIGIDQHNMGRNLQEKSDAFAAYGEKWAGTAAALLGRQAVLQCRMDSLARQKRSPEETEAQFKKAQEQRYRALYEDCKAFEKQRSGFSTDEKLISESCNGAERIIDNLDSQSLSVSVGEDSITVFFVNVKNASLTLRKQGQIQKGSAVTSGSEDIFKTNVKNPECSFYVCDSLVIPMPDIDDGDYQLKLESGKTVFETDFSRYHLSTYILKDASGLKIFTADCISGRPVDRYDIKLLKDGVTVAEVTGFKQDGSYVAGGVPGGLTALPEEIVSSMKTTSVKNRYVNYSIVCSFRDEGGVLYSSPKICISGSALQQESAVVRNRESDPCALIYHDSGIYHRGDTLHCKAVVFDMTSSMCAEIGTNVVMSFENASGKKLLSRNLSTDEYGSVAADFVIPSDYDGNQVHVSVMSGNSRIGGKNVMVDDVVLPELYCVFDKVNEMYFPGDTVILKGRIGSYSGAPVRLDRSYYELDGVLTSQTDAGTVMKRAMTFDDDGSFAVEVVLPMTYSWRGVNLDVTAVSSTGETQKFSRHLNFGGEPDLSICVKDELQGQIKRTGGSSGYLPNAWMGYSIVNMSDVSIEVDLENGDDVLQMVPVCYSVRKDGKEIFSSGCVSGKEFSLHLESDGEYVVEFNAEFVDSTGKQHKVERKVTVLKISRDSNVLNADLEHVFVPGKDGISFDFGATGGPVWAVAMISDNAGRLLRSGLLTLAGIKGEQGSLMHVRLPYEKDYPESVLLEVFYFRNEQMCKWNHGYNRSDSGAHSDAMLCLEFERFEDKTVPGTQCSIRLKSSAESQAVVTAFDKSSETVVPNRWYQFGNYFDGMNPLDCFYETGTLKSFRYGNVRRTMMTKALSVNSSAVLVDDNLVLEEVVMHEDAETFGIEIQDYDGTLPPVRSNFATTLCWEPFVNLRPTAEVKFRTSDKLGTFVVQVFAHDKNMRNAVLRRELVVTMPVQLSVAQPQILSVGDSYVLKAVLSAMDDAGAGAGHDARKQPSAISGTMVLDAGPLGRFSKPVTVNPGHTADVEFPLEISADAVSALAPEQDGSSFMDLPLKVSFLESSGRFSDAVLVHVPVRSNMQTLTEAHSAVLLSGQDEDAALAALRKEFVNTSSYGAQYSSIKVIDMVRSALGDRLLEPVARKSGGRVVPDGRHSSLAIMDCLCTNVMFTSLTGWDARPDSLSRAQYSELLSILKSALANCQKPDGGYAWYEDMASSPLVTATILERNARLAKYSDILLISGEALEKAVGYLDKSLFSKQWDYDSWCSWSLGISLPQYLYVRSFYTDLPFDVSVMKQMDKEQKKAFEKKVSSYLCPKKARGLNGQVFDKSIRLNTLRNLMNRDGGVAFIKSLGVGTITAKKLRASYEADVASLVQYIVSHPSGGKYCPNLVMPFRGLLASEAYCHSLLCDLMQTEHPEISDGIRLWLMLQKETQKWDRNFEFVNAIAAILDGSEALKQTTVAVMSKTYEKPCSEIAAAGNGFSISRSYTVTSSDGKQRELQDGDILDLGDRIMASYRIFNAENRSFVHVTVPRPGCLRPVNQLSGYVGGALRQLSWNGSGRGNWYSLSPSGYRDVRSDRTEYHFDVFPEEESVLTEEYFVTQAGSFTAPVLTIESQYAPHYRANSAFDGAMRVK